MKFLTGLIFFAAFLAVRLDAEAGTSTSGNISVDTTGPAGNVTVTMFRAKESAVLENAVEGVSADEPLRVKAITPATMASLAVVPAWNSSTNTGGGLVADGVTPLIFRIAANGTPSASGDRYVVAVGKKWDGVLSFPFPRLSLAGSAVSSPEAWITLTPANPVAFVVLNAIQAEDLMETGFPGVVVATLTVRDATNGKRRGEIDFGVSFPPVVLVHGYNVSDPQDWGTDFRYNLRVGRPDDFVIVASYGVENDFNTTGSLGELTKTLYGVLLVGMEKEGSRSAVLNQWAWTRYDAVGHSQGGVLLRLLCSQREKIGGGTVYENGFDPWRNHRNHYRGRFHRVVTIGSPHAGSTLAELGIQLQNEGVPIRYETAAELAALAAGGPLVGPFWAQEIKDEVKRLFQSKFRVGSPSQLATINDAFQCDPYARLHLLRTTIYGGLAPGESGNGWWPFYYSALYLNEATPTVNGLSPGEVVAPNGADGVVDTDSQGAGAGSNHTSAITGENIIHADVPYLDDEVGDTHSQTVADKVAELLKGSAAAFGPVTIPAALKATMAVRRENILTLAQAIRGGQRREPGSLYSGGGGGGGGGGGFLIPAPGETGKTASFTDQTLHFTLQPPAGESPNGPVEWTTVVYGPEGMAATGLTMTTAGTSGDELTMFVAASVQGQVVLSVSFRSTSGKMVFGSPQVVLNRPTGSVLTSLALSPAVIELQVGAEVSLALSGIYDGTVSSRLFTNAANTSFVSSDPSVATVDADGRVKLIALGMARITATYNGTLMAAVVVTVLDVAPVVVSPPTIPATVGQYLSLQLSASQVVQSFTMDALPTGLSLDAQSGLIEGVPTTEGRFPAVVTVQNANGTGSKQMEFVIAGVPGAPTDVSLDAAGVNGGKPVGTVVGRLVTVDPNPLDTFTYQLVSGAGGADNGLFTIAGNSLVTAAVLNRAATSTVTIRVRTTDSWGASFEKALVLPVGTPPAIVRQPDAREVFVGESAIFFVETTGLEPLQYQWKKGGVDVAGATSRIFEVSAASLADAGNYTVAVSNGDGSVTSAAASLAVNPITYGKWAAALPSGMASALFEPGADYNADGIVNFLDFAFGVQPGLESGVGAQPSVSRDALGYVLTYREADSVSPLTYRILKSVNLGAWTEHVPVVGDVTRTNLGTHTVVAVRVPSPAPGLFFKLEVSSQ